MFTVMHQSVLTIMDYAFASEVRINPDQTQISRSGAHFAKDLKPKIFVSSIQTVWNFRKF